MREKKRVLWYNEKIYFSKNKHSMVLECAKLRIYPIAVILTSMVGSFVSPVYAGNSPYDQEFIVTAYYSPLPNQCCYFRGSYGEDIAFNGQGKRGADGTGVYEGMIAAPPSYGFGTRIDLRNLGVGTVHDRGGRIIEWSDDLHRIDLWMGTGEEGLARALAWGTRRVSGTVYPLGSESMPRETFSFDALPADTSTLAFLPKTENFLLFQQAEFGHTGYASRFLQSTLRDLGYFEESATGEFGPVTQDALHRFMQDAGLHGDGRKVDERTAAALTVAMGIEDKNLPDLAVSLRRGNRGSDVRQAQKLLRFIGFYRGRTDGVFSPGFRDAVVALQLKSGVLSSAEDRSAGLIGPATRSAILRRWKMQIVARKYPAVVRKMNIVARVHSDSLLPSKVLSVGDQGREVRLLQIFLRDRGYLSTKDTTGTFGERTAAGLLKYQMDRKIVSSGQAHGAGVFGPATRAAATRDIVAQEWQSVRVNGVTSM